MNYRDTDRIIKIVWEDKTTVQDKKVLVTIKFLSDNKIK